MNSLLALFPQYGTFIMFILILAEYACLPVSSEIILPFAGAYAASCQLPFSLMLSLSILAGILGTSFCYFLGKWGGTFLLNKISRRFPKTERPLSASLYAFKHYGVLAVCIGRVIPLCRTYIAFIAGALEQPYTVFLPASLLGITVWNCTLIGIGYFFGENQNTFLALYNKYREFFIFFLLNACFFFLLRHFSKKKK